MIKLCQLLSEIYIDGFTVSEAKGGFHRPENFDSYAEGKGWVAYRGGNDWENGTTACAVYFKGGGEEIARIWFEVKFPKDGMQDSNCPEEIRDEANKWGKKASTLWISTTKKIHSVPKDHFPDGDPWYKDWKECFIEALKSKEMQKYVKDWGVDHTTWKAMKESKPESVNEGTAVPGAMEGWLSNTGTCYYVPDTHSEWAARMLKEPAPDETDIGAYERQRIRLMKVLYDKGWVRIVIKHDTNLIYFDTYDTPWTSLTRPQRVWLINAAIHGVKRSGDTIETGDKDEHREPPYKIEFGNKGGEILSPEKLGAL